MAYLLYYKKGRLLSVKSKYVLFCLKQVFAHGFAGYLRAHAAIGASCCAVRHGERGKAGCSNFACKILIGSISFSVVCPLFAVLLRCDNNQPPFDTSMNKYDYYTNA